MTLQWETQVLYRRILRVGGVWNLVASLPLVILVPFLPDMLGIEPPVHPIFIYFNLMTVMMFGFIHFYVASHLDSMRGMMKILMWSKLLTGVVFVAALLFESVPRPLAEFIGPGMAIDVAFGLIYLRYLFYSPAAATAS